MELRELGRRVGAVAGLRIDMRRREQPAFVVVPKSLDGDLRKRRKVTDLQHASLFRVSSKGRVKRNFAAGLIHHKNATDCSVVTSKRLRQRTFLQPTMSSRRTM